MSDIIPIEIRPGKYVYIQDIPHDLSDEEARKIAGVVLALGQVEARPGHRLSDHDPEPAER